MASKDALGERERLRAEIARAREARSARGAQADQLRAELKAIPREREAALRDQARTGSSPIDLDQLDRREAALRSEIEREAGAAKAASAAAKAAEGELRQLHHDQFAAFAEHAEELTEEAEAKLDALRAGYEDAYQAAEAAGREWSLIVRDRNAVVLGRLTPADRVHGEHRRQSISRPPATPLKPPGEVFNSPPIRPAEVELAEEVA